MRTLLAVRCYVEPSPAGGYHVKLRGSDAPLSHHDTEDEAEAAAAGYEAGLARGTGEHVTLPDGADVVVRAVRAEDKPLFVAGWQRFGDESRRSRFLAAKPRLTVADLAFFTELDHVDHEAIGALDPRTGDGLGVARYIREAERPHVAEAAVAVIDAWQGRGLGGLLLRRLRERAADEGIRCFSASLSASNVAMLRLFQRLGTVTTRQSGGAALEIDVELPLSDHPTLEMALRNAATGHLRRRDGAPLA